MNAHENSTWLGLQERVCVVTGGASGIGAETARQLASAGARVVILDRDGKGALSMAAEIRQKGGNAIGLSADVTQPASIAAAVEAVAKQWGACQVLVNNAAILSTDPVMTLDLEKWNQLIAVNLTGALVCAQAFGRQMAENGQGGSIIHVASIGGEHPMPRGGGYSVSKAGLMMLSRVLSLELSEHHIRSNVVAPGLVRTPFSEFLYRDPEVVRQREQIIPVGRISSPIDVANAIVFLASDRSSYIDGQEFHVDGGLSQSLLKLIPSSKPQ